MEQLKQYLRDHIIFDEHDCLVSDFSKTLCEELDRISIYHSDNKEFFNIDSDNVLRLALMEDFEINTKTSLDDIVREAQTNLAFNYMYSELEEMYGQMEV